MPSITSPSLLWTSAVTAKVTSGKFSSGIHHSLHRVFSTLPEMEAPETGRGSPSADLGRHETYSRSLQRTPIRQRKRILRLCREDLNLALFGQWECSGLRCSCSRTDGAFQPHSLFAFLRDDISMYIALAISEHTM